MGAGTSMHDSPEIFLTSFLFEIDWADCTLVCGHLPLGESFPQIFVH